MLPDITSSRQGRSLLNDGERYTDSKTPLPIADSLGKRMRSREELAAFRKA
ncbi:MAG: hypothetical protein PUP91_24845 [Rhizonema sp. PD37]|nr:hypothetical protein [Rhizonema sp. PD37]